MLKKTIAMMLVALSLLSLVACKKDEDKKASEQTTAEQTTAEQKAEEQKSEDVEMKYMSSEDLNAKLDDANYLIIDARKAEDYAAGHIKNAVNADMDKAKDGDAESGKSNMQAAIGDAKDKTIVLVCYSGKKYAQAGTNALSALGYDMEKVFTLEGGMKDYEGKFADSIVK